MKNLARNLMLKRIRRSLDIEYLQYVNNYQIENYENLWLEINDIISYYSKKTANTGFVDRNWREWCKSITKIYLNKDELFRFSQDPIIIKTMTGEPVLDRNKVIVDQIIPELRMFIHEDLIGNNLIVNKKYMSSVSRTAHLYVATLIYKLCREHALETDRIVEVGGGFGGLMSLFLRGNRNLRFNIFDLPEILPLQYIYINTTCRVYSDDPSIPKENFRAIQDIEMRSSENSIFISNWALTESTRELQDFAIDSKFFSATAAFICCEDNNQNHSDSKYIHKYLEDKSVYVTRLQGTMSNSKFYFLDLRQ